MKCATSVNPSPWSSPNRGEWRRTLRHSSTVEYEPLPAVCDVREGLKPGAPTVHAGIENNLVARVPFVVGNVDAGVQKRGPHDQGVLRYP